MNLNNQYYNKSTVHKVSQKTNTIWKVIKFIKEYLSVIIFVPTVLGGLWQLSVLWSFGLAYIRFFSISQLVSDGLIALLFIPLVLLVTFVSFTISQVIKPIETGDKVFYILPSIFVVSCLWLVFRDFNTIPYLEMYLFTWIGLFGGITLESHRRYFIIKNKKLIKEENKKSLKDWIKSIYKLNTITIIFNYIRIIWIVVAVGLTFIMYCIVSVKIMFSVGEYYIPNDLYNIKIVEESVQKNFNIEKEDFEISYYNDSYIFVTNYKQSSKVRDSLIQKNEKPKSEIIILKSDEFFD